MDLLYFVLLVSSLIFIHESGHFAFAKIFGVKVLTFSIGFGPKIVRLRGKETEYCVALLPFGGFVKMLEESKHADPILPEERGRTFEAQALWKRIVIVLAGPAMNVLFPIALYTSVYLEDRQLLPATVGVVVPGSAADGKLQPGDRVVSVDGQAIASDQELNRFIAPRAGRAVTLGVERDGRTLDVTLTPSDEVQVRELDIVEHKGRIGFEPRFPSAVIGVSRHDSPAGAARLQTFDRITSVNGRHVERFIDLVDALADNRGDQVVVSYLRPVDVPQALGGLCDLGLLEPGLATLSPLPRAPGVGAPADAVGRAIDVLQRTGLESADMYVAFVPRASGEWRAGLLPGDRVTMLDGVPARLWRSLADELAAGADRMHELQWTRDGVPMAGRFQLRKEQWDDEFGQHYERYVFRTNHWLPAASDRLVPNPHPLVYAVRRGLDETVSVIQFISVGLLRLAQGRVSLSSMSGPITMYDIAGQAGAKGTTHFVWAMALISVNLGLINLLPIPVLDGGHLLFFLFEAARRKPLPLRIREVASLVGMVVLVLLILVAFKNDVERRWDVIVSQVRGNLVMSRAPTARQVAALVLGRVLKDAAFAAAALEGELGRAAQLDARDRALATELVYGTLRVKPWLEAEIDRFAPRGTGALDASVRAHMLLSVYQLYFLRVPAFAAVSEAVEAVRAGRGAKLAGFANAVLRKVAARAAAAGETVRGEAIVSSTPAWLLDALSRALSPEGARALLASGGQAPAIALRVEQPGERDAWIERLRAAVPSASFEPGRVSPRAILVRGAGRPADLPGWAEGAFTVQEEGSQVAALAVGARPGERVLDACAGRGNKSSVLARAVGAEGRVHACDTSPSKLARLEQELARLGLRVTATHAVDWRVGLGDVAGPFDRILVDAPCTGVGTLRRRPDIALRVTEPDVAARTAAQREILERVAPLLGPGGSLVYVVCSVLREEGEDVAAALVAGHPELSPAAFDAPELRAIAGDAPHVRLLPHVHGTDGYFIARWVKRAETG